MTPFLLAAALVLLILIVMFLSRSGFVPWMDQMTRLNAGAINRAEWMAPPHVIAAVKHDYLAFYIYASAKLPKGWLAYMRDLNEYLSHEMLSTQRESLNLRLMQDRGRFIDILRATHHVQVRHFSDDGLSCIVIDQQSEQRIATYDYWTGRRLHTQFTGNAVYIYEMRYDQSVERWKIARFIQQLPPGISQPGTLEIHLPSHIGRDQ